jgi:hypothetical protein
MNEVPKRLPVDADLLQHSKVVEFRLNAGVLYKCQVILGSGQWPTPFEVGIYLDAEDDMCAIIEWQRPCTPKILKTQFGTWLIHLNTASEEEILAADIVEVDSFFRNR